MLRSDDEYANDDDDEDSDEVSSSDDDDDEYDYDDYDDEDDYGDDEDYPPYYDTEEGSGSGGNTQSMFNAWGGNGRVVNVAGQYAEGYWFRSKKCLK